MKLHISHPDAEPYDLGPYGYTLEEALDAEATTIAQDAGSDLLEDPGEECRDALRQSIVDDALATLTADETYTDPTGVRWTLTD